MSPSIRSVVIQRAQGRDIELDAEAGARFRAEWEFRSEFGDNRPIDVLDVDGVQREVRPREVTEVKNRYS
jgi:hypothetical protein